MGRNTAPCCSKVGHCVEVIVLDVKAALPLFVLLKL
jgi:hypothetical protein